MDDLIEGLFQVVFEILGELFSELLTPIFSKIRIAKWLKITLVSLLSAVVLGALIVLFIYGWQEIGVVGFLACLSCMALPCLIWLAVILWNRLRFGTLRKARKEDLPAVLKLYRSVIGTPGCHWSITYPNEVTLHEDFRTGNLYVLWKGKMLVGAGSVVAENELDDLPCWHDRENTREIARIVINPSFQGKGHGRRLILKLCRVLHKSGCKGVHLLASAKNNRAKNLYRECGFYNRGPCHRYDHDFYAYERKL